MQLQCLIKRFKSLPLSNSFPTTKRNVATTYIPPVGVLLECFLVFCALFLSGVQKNRRTVVAMSLRLIGVYCLAALGSFLWYIFFLLAVTERVTTLLGPCAILLEKFNKRYFHNISSLSLRLHEALFCAWPTITDELF